MDFKDFTIPGGALKIYERAHVFGKNYWIKSFFNYSKK